MNTFLSSAQSSLQKEYLSFVQEQIAPLAKELDCNKACSKDALAKLAQGGFLGLTVAKEYGGQGRGLVEVVLFLEQLSKISAGLGLALVSHYEVVELVQKFAGDALKSRFLPLLARGELIGAQAFGEDKAGSDFTAVTSSLVSQGKELILDGEKHWVVNGVTAGLIAVLAKEAGELALVLVDAQQETACLVKGANKAKLGLKAASTNDIKFIQHKLNADNLILKGEKVFPAVDLIMGFGKTLMAAVSVGLAEEALNLAAEHARTREVSGHSIGQFQGIQWKLADHATESTAGRLLTYRAAWSYAEAPEDFRKFAAMAKMFASRVARFHSSEAVQIFGMLGASLESPIEGIYRDAKLTEIFEGTSEIQKVIIKEELGV